MKGSMKSIYKDSMYKDRHQETRDSAEPILSLALESLPPVHSVVHPEMYTLKMDQAASVSGSLKFLRRAITRPIKKRLKAVFSKE